MRDTLGQGCSTPTAIFTDDGDFGNLSLDFDQDGNWHLIYGDDYGSDEVIKYLNNTSGAPVTIVEPYPDLGYSDIAVDPNGGLHVMFVRYTGTYPSLQSSIMHMHR